MAITNGYCTLAQFKTLPEIDSTNATDDTFVEETITRISREIDRECGKWFYARTLTRTYDIPPDRQLDLDVPLLTVTTLTNGDATTIAATDYTLFDPNTSPYYAIRLKQSSSVIWLPDSDGNIQNVLSVAGTWGYVSRSATDDRSVQLIRNTETLCLIWSLAEYKRRYGFGVEGKSTVTAAGVVITPTALPDSARMILESLKRVY